nr:uncharacterized protein CI109_004244 [Kwoniella shandongensis]KAA5527428.1 hypothetical protein CI109_004244 [Kwoniella shandongensis]
MESTVNSGSIDTNRVLQESEAGMDVEVRPTINGERSETSPTPITKMQSRVDTCTIDGDDIAGPPPMSIAPAQSGDAATADGKKTPVAPIDPNQDDWPHRKWLYREMYGRDFETEDTAEKMIASMEDRPRDIELELSTYERYFGQGTEGKEIHGSELPDGWCSTHVGEVFGQDASKRKGRTTLWGI